MTSPAPIPGDIWGLGEYYNKPIYLGNDEQSRTPNDLRKHIPQSDWGKDTNTPLFGQTQDILDGYAKLYARGKDDPQARADFTNIQLLLVESGQYGESVDLKKFRFGQWDSRTRDALKGALADYEQAVISQGIPEDFVSYLKDLRDRGSINGKPATDLSGGSTAPQAVVTDPAAIRSAVQTAAQAALGHGLSEDQLSTFVSQFQGAQSSAQTSTDSTVTQPSLQDRAMQYAQQTDPQDYSNHQAKSYMNAFINLFAPTGSTRANIQEVPSV